MLKHCKEWSNAMKWKYKAEGNKHIVVSDGQGNCLRLLKHESPLNTLSVQHAKADEDLFSNGQINCYISHENHDELMFIEYVILPLMNYCDACHIPKAVKLPDRFLHDLDKKIRVNRPVHRKHQPLNCNASNLLMQDYCFVSNTKNLQHLIKNGLMLDSPVFSVELKLKNGFLKGYNVDNIKMCNSSHYACQFCKTQIYRVLQQKRYKSCSMYCPLDIFSGNELLMKKALYHLLLTPQNNFRIFRNGDLLYSQEIADAFKDKERSSNSAKAGHDYIASLEQLFCKLLSNEEKNAFTLDVLVDVLCKSLLLPVVSSISSNIPHAESCHGAYYKKRMFKNLFEFPDFKSVGNKAVPLPSNSILGIIFAQQQMDKYSLSEILRKWNQLRLFLSSHSELAEELAIGAPYNSKGWQHFARNPLESKKTHQHDEIHQISHELRQFFVAKSFNDCSVMVSFQKATNVPESSLEQIKLQSHPSASFNVVKSGDNHYIVSLAVVDTDPKPTANLPSTFQKYFEISDWWTKQVKIA